ncbi:MAG: hypothetical protein H6747_01515 [Deltaproteobacteria bacterium]|nr:hypothetical protein [Deltaproteobacteria bacterium]
MAHSSNRMGQRRPHSLAVALATLLFFGCSDDAGPTTGTTSDCAAAADCAASTDLCAGPPQCVKGLCVFDDAARVACDDAADGPCNHNVCDPTNGTCTQVPRNTGLGCEDGDPCTIGDTCKAGACTAGATDLCGCRKDADCADDGDLCNGTPRCDLKSFPYRCVAGTPLTCPAATEPCTVAVCTPSDGSCGVGPAPDDTPCDDNDLCTSGDTCQQGSCQGGTDTCACSKDSDCVDDDDNPCTGVPFCDKTEGPLGSCKSNPASAIVCSKAADTDCAKNTCLPQTGACVLLPVADTSTCDDGDECTVGDVCVAGSCKGGTDTCKCTQDSDCSAADDGNLCNGLPFCNVATGACETNPATVVNCPTVDDTACSKNVCDPKSGTCSVLPRAEVKLIGCQAVDLGFGIIAQFCTFAPKQSGEAADPGPYACDDGDACTSDDICSGTTCSGNAFCECQVDADCAGKDDGDLCNGTWYCDVSTASPSCKPQPNSEIYCPKGQDSECLKSTCNPKTAACSLQPVAPGTACDDGDPCTAKSACAAGSCAGGAAADCDDGDACTADACSKDKGCTHVGKDCDDGNVCTIDACAAETGQCSHTPRPKGYVCDADQDGCTVADACDGTVCKAGAPFSCPAATAPCVTNVCVSAGSNSASCATIAQPNGATCADDAKACLLGATCKAGACVEGDKPRLYSENFGQEGVPGVYHDVAAAPSGGFVAVGQERPGKPADGQWLVTRIARDGSTMWEARVQNPAGKVDAETAAGAVANPGDGAVWVAGRIAGADGKRTAEVRRFAGATGKLLGTTVIATDKVRRVVAMQPVATGGVVVAFAHDDSSTATECVVHSRITATGAQDWSTASVCNLQAGGSLANSLTVTPELAVTVRTRPVGGDMAWSYHVMDLATGDTVVGAASTAVGTFDEGVATAPLGGGRVAILHSDRTGVTPSPGSQLRLLRSDGSRGFDEPRMLDLVGPIAMASRGSSGALGLIGSTSKGGYFAGLNRVGSLQWQRGFTENQPSSMQALAAVQDDLVAVGWRRDAGGVDRPWVIRAGPYGHTSCGALGVCKGLGWAGCDDTTDCTADACDAVAGCSHSGQTATSCTPEDTCSAQGVCKLGACKPSHLGRLLNLRQGFSTADGKTIDAASTSLAVETDAGAIQLAGFTEGKSSIFRIAIDALGAEVHPKAQALCPFMTAGSGLVSLGGGDILAFGTGGGKARLCRLPADLDAIIQPSIDLGACTDCVGTSEAVAGAVRSDGSIVALTHETIGGGLLVRAARVSSKNAPLWNRPLATLTQGRGIAATAVGGAIVAGASGAGAATVGTVAALDPNGAVVWVHQPEQPVASVYHAAAESSEGDAIAAGALTFNATTHNSIVTRLEGGSGAVMWSRVAKAADLSVPGGVVATEGDGVVIGGDVVVATVPSVYIERLDPKGALIWRKIHRFRNLWATEYPSAFGGLGRWSGGLLLAGHTTVPSYPAVLRMDHSGHAACDASGACVDNKPSTCDDKNPCTSDWCDANGGCQHSQIAGCKTCTDDAACKTGAACLVQTCDAGRCVASPKLSVACCPSPLLSESFEGVSSATLSNSKGGDKGWNIVSKAKYATSATGALVYGDPVSGSYAYGGAHSGTATWPALQVPTDQAVQLGLRLYLAVESNLDYDKFEVRLLRQGKPTVVLWSKQAGTTNAWLDLKFPLAAYAGETVQLQLSFDTVDDFGNATPGVFVDDVVIATPCGG